MRLFIAVTGAVSMTLISCVVGPPAPITLPTPPSPAVRPGPWDTTYALYDPALFGPERPLADLIAAYGLRLRDGKLRDARSGLEAGRINQRQLEAIAAALKKGECPPQDTNLGGRLLLHGQLPEYTAGLARDHRRQPGAVRPGLQVGDADPSEVREFYDWTDGCAALFNPDIRELYEFIPDGAPLTIVANGPVTPPPTR